MSGTTTLPKIGKICWKHSLFESFAPIPTLGTWNFQIDCGFSLKVCKQKIRVREEVKSEVNASKPVKIPTFHIPTLLEFLTKVMEVLFQPNVLPAHLLKQ